MNATKGIKYNVDVKGIDELVSNINKHKSFGPNNFAYVSEDGIGISIDGVGTKALLARDDNDYEIYGYDAVAMNVNDLVACGITPRYIVNKISANKIDGKKFKNIIKGIELACNDSNSKLVGGETAEMQGVYANDFHDIVVTAIGESIKCYSAKSIKKGDFVIGLPSNGIHANGLTLIRDLLDKKLIDRKIIDWCNQKTRIYVKELIALYEKGLIKNAAHITGGGFENIGRIVELKRIKWNGEYKIPEEFHIIAKAAKMTIEELKTILNVGIGMVVISGDYSEIKHICKDAILLGEINED